MSGTTSAAPRAAEHRVGSGLHRPVRAGVPQHGPAVRRAAAGDPGAQGQRPGRHRASAGEPVAGHGGRCARGDGRQPDLRRAERPDHVPVRQAATVDDRRSRRRNGRDPGRRARPERRRGAARLVRGAGLLQRAARRPGGRAAGPGTGRPARHGRRGPRRVPAARVGGRHVRRQRLLGKRAGDVHGAVRDRRPVRGGLRAGAGRPSAGTRRSGRPGRSGAPWPRSTSTRAGIPTSCGPSSAASCSSSPTPCS